MFAFILPLSKECSKSPNNSRRFRDNLWVDRTLKLRVLLEEESIESDVDVDEVEEEGLRNVRTFCQKPVIFLLGCILLLGEIE